MNDLTRFSNKNYIITYNYLSNFFYSILVLLLILYYTGSIILPFIFDIQDKSFLRDLILDTNGYFYYYMILIITLKSIPLDLYNLKSTTENVRCNDTSAISLNKDLDANLLYYYYYRFSILTVNSKSLSSMSYLRLIHLLLLILGLSFIVLSYFNQVNPIYFFTFPLHCSLDYTLTTLQFKETANYISTTIHNKPSELISFALTSTELELPILKSETLIQMNDLTKYNRFTHITQYNIVTSAIQIVNSAGLLVVLSTLFYVLLSLGLFSILLLAILKSINFNKNTIFIHKQSNFRTNPHSKIKFTKVNISKYYNYFAKPKS